MRAVADCKYCRSLWGLPLVLGAGAQPVTLLCRVAGWQQPGPPPRRLCHHAHLHQTVWELFWWLQEMSLEIILKH